MDEQKNPDLSFVKTRDLFDIISKRYDAAVIVMVRKGLDGEVKNIMCLSYNINSVSGFLDAVAERLASENTFELNDDDL